MARHVPSSFLNFLPGTYEVAYWCDSSAWNHLVMGDQIRRTNKQRLLLSAMHEVSASSRILSICAQTQTGRAFNRKFCPRQTTSLQRGLRTSIRGAPTPSRRLRRRHRRQTRTLCAAGRGCVAGTARAAALRRDAAACVCVCVPMQSILPPARWPPQQQQPSPSPTTPPPPGRRPVP